MKQKIKTVLKRIAILFVFVVAMIGVITTTYEAVVRPVAVEYLAKEDAPRATSTKEVVVSEYEIWLAGEEGKAKKDEMETRLELEFKKHQRKLLDDEIASLGGFR